MQNAIIFPPKLVDIQNYYYFKAGFSNEELDKIYRDVAFLPFQEGKTGADSDGNDKKMRTSQIKWIHPSQQWEWLYDKLMNMIIEANENLWHFNITSILDAIQYTEYHASENGHYGWHQDLGSGMLSTRKISVTVQLSDPSEYDGGDLEYFIGGDPENPIKVERNKGLVFIFPSFMMHRVTPVTRGVRRSFVLWIGGEHFK
jgi:PKHD-type hydroxylase